MLATEAEAADMLFYGVTFRGMGAEGCPIFRSTDSAALNFAHWPRALSMAIPINSSGLKNPLLQWLGLFVSHLFCR